MSAQQPLPGPELPASLRGGGRVFRVRVCVCMQEEQEETRTPRPSTGSLRPTRERSTFPGCARTRSVRPGGGPGVRSSLTSWKLQSTFKGKCRKVSELAGGQVEERRASGWQARGESGHRGGVGASALGSESAVPSGPAPWQCVTGRDTVLAGRPRLACVSGSPLRPPGVADATAALCDDTDAQKVHCTFHAQSGKGPF